MHLLVSVVFAYQYLHTTFLNFHVFPLQFFLDQILILHFLIFLRPLPNNII